MLMTGLILLLSAMAVLYGWQQDNQTLKSVLPALTPMNPTTALCFLALGGALIAQSIGKLPARLTKAIAIGSALLLLIIGSMMLLYYASKIDLRIDRQLFPSKLGINRMAPSTALCLVLLGGGLLAAVMSTRRQMITKAFAIAILFIAFYTLIGYAYGVQPVYGSAVLNPMALHVSILFLLASIALLSQVIDGYVFYISPGLIATYIFAIGIFIFLSAYSFRSFIHLGTNSSQVQVAYEQQSAINNLRTALLDAETGQRGYILTGDKQYLIPYYQAVAHVDGALRSVQKFPSEMVSPAESMSLKTLTNDKLAELKQTVLLRDSKGVSAATGVVQTNAGLTYMDQIRSILQESDARIAKQLQLNLQQSKVQRNKSLLLLAISTASILSLLLASLYFLQEKLKHQSQDARANVADKESAMIQNQQLETEVSDQIKELERVKDSLSDEVTSRTAELNTELGRTNLLNSFMIDRELRIKSLKDEIKQLKSERPDIQ